MFTSNRPYFPLIPIGNSLDEGFSSVSVSATGPNSIAHVTASEASSVSISVAIDASGERVASATAFGTEVSASASGRDATGTSRAGRFVIQGVAALSLFSFVNS